ncbi:hypothetical protein [Vulcaniibacterium gelatinicum]|uniref:hypothetical protein n=1 Tax=Vulcaniibacterium gelatinicum TaxID=2598725 RepID=UPI0011CBB9FF|nr:hypothetical protein [Vulcaniibacterium gelatinicum]
MKTSSVAVLGGVILLAGGIWLLWTPGRGTGGAEAPHASVQERQARRERPAPSRHAAAGPESALATLGRAYGAPSHMALLRATAELDPAFALDAHDLVQWAERFCSVMGAGSRYPGTTYTALYERMVAREIQRAHPQVQASHAYLDQVRSRYCDAGTPPAEPERLWDERMQIRLAAGIESPDHARLVEAQAQGADLGTEHVLSVALDVASSTRSPAVFKEAVDVLAANGWSPPGFRMPGLSHEQQQMMIRELGALLAMCALNGGGCGPGKLMAIRWCLPSDCVPGESLQDFLARNHTPNDFRAAQAYANALLAMRRRP